MKIVLSWICVFIWAVLFTACELFNPKTKISEGHIQSNTSTEDISRIPEPVRIAPALPLPEPVKNEPSHTVVVHEVPVRELLFSLARDAEVNLDISNDVDGTVTLNAVKQPLTAILARITEEVGLRYEIKNNVLKVRKDSPFLRNYRVDYLNMARTSEANVSVSTQISSTGQGAGGEGGGGGGGDNNSATSVKNVSEHSFWSTLEKNIAAIIYEGGAKGEVVANNPNIILNRESGVLGVRATQRQHREIQSFIDEVQGSTRRQVLIEATIAEVKLSDRYQAGIDWNLLKKNVGTGIEAEQLFTDTTLLNRPTFAATLTDLNLDGKELVGTLRALEVFGDVSVMSSPKVMALNNQTSLLKVVDNLVYFTVDVTIELGTGDSASTATYETEIKTVPVGFVMSVTPYINEYGSVTLNVRPTISRVIDRVRDPNPALAQVEVVSEIPVIQVREVESVLKVNSGDIAIIGGLMQDEINNNTEGIPFLSRLPILGPLFRYQDDRSDKTELVIFIKPQVIEHASLRGDLKNYQRYLPTELNR